MWSCPVRRCRFTQHLRRTCVAAVRVPPSRHLGFSLFSFSKPSSAVHGDFHVRAAKTHHMPSAGNPDALRRPPQPFSTTTLTRSLFHPVSSRHALGSSLAPQKMCSKTWFAPQYSPPYRDLPSGSFPTPISPLPSLCSRQHSREAARKPTTSVNSPAQHSRCRDMTFPPVQIMDRDSRRLDSVLSDYSSF